MRKKGKKNIFILFGICTLLLVGIFITAGDSITVSKISDRIAKSIGDNADRYIERIVSEKNIDIENITNVSEVDFENPPKQVNIGEVKNTNLAFYKIDFKEAKKSSSIFVIRYFSGGINLTSPIKKNVTLMPGAGGEFPEEVTPPSGIPKFLNFESVGEMDKSGFLDSSPEIKGNINKGYIMANNGNIINLSTHLEIYEGEGTVSITLYKNGAPTSLTTSFVLGKGQIVVDPNTPSYFIYSIFSEETVAFKKGDIISIYISFPDGVTLKSITTSAATG